MPPRLPPLPTMVVGSLLSKLIVRLAPSSSSKANA